MQKMFIVAAPSGAGKSSFVERITKEIQTLEDTITYTTRAMRTGESEGRPYHFVPRAKFEELVKQNFFIEWAEVHGNLYGTPEHQIYDIWKRGHAVIMDVDVQGAATFRDKFPEATSIFILPPSIDELRRRVEKRDGKVPADIEVRMANAEVEMDRAYEFDYKLINDKFEESYQIFKKLIVDLLAKR